MRQGILIEFLALAPRFDPYRFIFRPPRKKWLEADKLKLRSPITLGSGAIEVEKSPPSMQRSRNQVGCW
jgi:hypothetical protein